MNFIDYVTVHANLIMDTDFGAFNQAQEEIVSAMKSGKTIYLAGNGGSSSTASHFAVDWQKSVSKYLGYYPKVHCLTDNTPLISAIANDVSYDEIFSQQIENLSEDGDILLVISGSGNSINILRAVESANRNNLFTISLTGFDGGEVSKLVALNCLVPCNDIKVVEDFHLAFGHSVVARIEQLGKFK